MKSGGGDWLTSGSCESRTKSRRRPMHLDGILTAGRLGVLGKRYLTEYEYLTSSQPNLIVCKT